jgi:pectate lyase
MLLTGVRRYFLIFLLLLASTFIFPTKILLAGTGEPVAGLLDGLEGFGARELREAFGNYKKNICIVSKASDEAGSEKEKGTLRYFIEEANNAPADEMTWIIFAPDVFGADKNVTIDLHKALPLPSNTIIDGRGVKVTIASEDDTSLIQLRDSKNVIIKNLILHKVGPYVRQKYEKNIDFPVSRPGFDPARTIRGIDGDGVNFRGDSDNIWIDHCTFFLCGDECLGVMSSPEAVNTKITVSWCDFSDQYYAALIGHSTEEKEFDHKIRFTFHHNRVKGTARRNPRVNRATVDVYNNYIEGWKDWAMAANASAKVLIEANIFEASEDKMAINIGTRDHINGFVKIKDNLLLNGAVLDSYMPEEVPPMDYSRGVHEADEELKKLIKRDSGWQNIPSNF